MMNALLPMSIGRSNGVRLDRLVSTRADRRLEACLARIDRAIGLKTILDLPTDSPAVIDYFRSSFLAYTLFHSLQGSVHLAINRDGVYRSGGCLHQPREIARRIRRLRPKHVVELGCGRGYNLAYVARRYPRRRFTGIDITPRHLAMSRLRTLSCRNATALRRNFDDYEPAEESLGLVYDVEAICYSTRPDALLERIARGLRSGGEFVTFNGFRGPGFDAWPESWRLAARLIEASMAVPRFHTTDDWTGWARDAGLRLIEHDDLSTAVLPSFIRFRQLANRLFREGAFRDLFRGWLPRKTVLNAVAGMLSAETFQLGCHRYAMLAFRKE
jgi:SAM-dependent methyltransferase